MNACSACATSKAFNAKQLNWSSVQKQILEQVFWNHKMLLKRLQHMR